MKASFAPRHLAVTVCLFVLPQTVFANPTFDFYGHLNFGLFSVDDGDETETFFTDNDNSNTRVGFWYTTPLSNGSTLKANFETGVGIDGSSAATVDDNGLDFDWDETELRKFELIFETQNYGTFSAGQGSMPTDGATEADFSGTSVIAYSGIPDLAGSFQFRTKDGDFSGITVGSVFKSFDGGRLFRLRYDTPSWNNIVVSVAGGIDVLTDGNTDDFYEVAAKYAADYGDLKVDARAGYAWVDTDEGPNKEQLVGSVGGLHVPSGVSLSVAAGSEEKVGDSDFLYVKLGYQRDFFSFGRTFFSVDFADGDDFAVSGSDSDSWSVAAVQKVDQYNLEIFAVYRSHDLDKTGADLDDIDAFAIGARWKF